METNIIVIFCAIDDYLKDINFRDDNQAKMTTAEIMTVVLVASHYFGGNQEKAKRFLRDHHYISYMLSKSQFNRRLHAIKIDIWEYLQRVLGEKFKHENEPNEYIVDSFPVPVCHNIRINRSKIYEDEIYRGWSASKRQYFFGLKVHIIATTSRKPVEVILAPGSLSDITVFREFDFDLPTNAHLYADAGYTDYHWEDILAEAANINLFSARRSNSKRPHSLFVDWCIKQKRPLIETTFSTITNLFPKKIHAVTAKGFYLKVFCFILAYSLSFL